MARQGSAVVVHGQTIELAEDVAREIIEAGGQAASVAGAINDPNTSKAAVELAIARFGRLDTLVTCAGIQRYGDVVSTPEETWDEVFDVNVKGVYLAAHLALP